MTVTTAWSAGPSRLSERPPPALPDVEDHDKPLRSDSVTVDAAVRLPRQSSSQTRTDLLNAATRIVNGYVADGPRNTDPPVDLLPFIRLDEVLEGASELARQRLVDEGGMQEDERVAPLTPGAFYKAFAADYQDSGKGAALTAFRRIVTRQMIDNPIITTADAYIEWGRHVAEGGQPWTEFVRRGAETEYARWTSSPALILMYALALHAEDADVGCWAREVEAKQLAELARIFDTLLPVFGRQMRPGLTVDNMALVISDLIAGMAVGSRFTPDLRQHRVSIDIEESGKQDWHLCALAIWAIYNSFTEAIQEDAPPS